MPAYLFPTPIPACAEPGCCLSGRYTVRSDIFRDPQVLAHLGGLPTPRCLRHAKQLKARYEALEDG